jgi:MoaA/NifB/PqqE/SkfB family radical SAM enzyme
MLKAKARKPRVDLAGALAALGMHRPPASGMTDRVGEIYVMLTWRCNLRCRMCPMWGDRGFCRAGRLPQETLTLERLAAFIDGALPFRPRTVTLSGGEPLLSPLCMPLARRLAEKGLRVMLTTNATLLRELAPEDVAAFGQINVSLDGPPLVLEKIGRGGEETFSRAAEGIRWIMANRKAGRPLLQLITVITPPGVGRLAEMLERFGAEGIAFDSLLFQHRMFLSAAAARLQKRALARLLPGARDPGIWDALVARGGGVDTTTLEKELEAIRRRFPEAVVAPRLGGAETAAWYRGGSRTPAGLGNVCLSPWFDLGVTPYGEVWLCPGFPVGTIFDAGFEDLWNGERAAAVRKAVAAGGLMPGCRACFYLYNYRESGR